MLNRVNAASCSIQLTKSLPMLVVVLAMGTHGRWPVIWGKRYVVRDDVLYIIAIGTSHP